MRYLDADTLADCRNALGCQVPIAKIAAHVGVSVDELRHALGMPQWKDVPAVHGDKETVVDLWRPHELDGRL